MVAIAMKNLFSLILFLVISLCGVTLFGGAASAGSAEIRNVHIGFDGDRTRVVIDANQDLDFRQLALSSGGIRYVLDFDRLTWALPDLAAHQGEGYGAGDIQRFRYAHNSPTTSRLVFDLERPLILESSFTITPSSGTDLYRIVLDFRETDMQTFKRVRPLGLANCGGDSDTGAASAAPVLPLARAPEPPKYVVVIDAGHGGKDPGAEGIRGTFEKDVNLNAARQLRDVLIASGDYEVVMTRDSDVYVDHDNRIEVARAAKADIFISIHADAAGNRAVSGASVYTLSTAGDARVEKMIDQKGWSIPLEVEPSGQAAKDILQDLVARETLTKSAQFADILIPQLEKVGPILRNSHRQANFYVLLAPDVPAVLLEVGFLTNPNDENRLISETGLSDAVGAVKRAIDLYFEREEQVMAAFETNAG
ncbi:MAG: N-acetylmuramoyl-L-alanine amidase [Ponticaulis sp.]|nr:N-acetylmuramoyl-L-alanine amidase [Ponticaulis sp.]|tara:strand:+ start:17665 stop:18930 length:1266 start_codon:yes stop_codon:yes gene_type:complete